jgi:hypothetical protein
MEQAPLKFPAQIAKRKRQTEQNHMGGDRPRDQPWHLNASIGFICIVASSRSHLAGDNNGLLAFTTNNT